jgi:RimJ/RimL family protein N-acetyltransferase
MRMSWYKWIKGMYSKSTKYDVRIMLAIELKTNNQLIGMVGIGNKEEVDNEVEVAYFVTESMSGNGYMTEAVAGIKNWALHQYDLPYLIAIVEYDNISSQRVIEKNGFKLYDSKKIINSGETEMKPFYYYKYENY